MLTNHTKNKEQTLIIHPVLPLSVADKQRYTPSLEDKLEELEGLARAISLDVLTTETIRVTNPTAGYLFAKGGRDSIMSLVDELEPDLIIINHSLTPVQQRNLEEQWQTKVIDRTGLILEIFGERAQTREGKIQVELAAQEYQRSRLVRSWTHLERQRGGAGFMGGPGETQLEVDRRMIGKRIARLKKDLLQVSKNRDLQRRSREKVPFPIIALVGYTNAGKSTLFNRLTGADVFAEDLLFATLDPTMRKLALGNGQTVILSDTVGFISDLPTHLIAAFRATLEQVLYADVILHVRDISQPDHEFQKQEVIKILSDLGIVYDEDNRVIEALNKTDRLSSDEQKDRAHKASFQNNAVPLSALTGEGQSELISCIEAVLSQNRKTLTFKIPATDGKAIAWLYEHTNFLVREDKELYISATVEISAADMNRFTERFLYKPLTTGKENDRNKEPLHGA